MVMMPTGPGSPSAVPRVGTDVPPPVTTDRRPPPVFAPHHLVHRPETPEAFLLGSTAPVRQSFAFSCELPARHPLFSDSAAPYHDLLLPVESLREAALFVAQRYFRVPPKRHAVFASGTARITAVPPWRIADAGRSQVGLNLDVTPTDVVNGVPRGLECRASVSIDGAPCGEAGARLVFLMPGVYMNHRAAGRRESELTAGTSPGAPGGDAPAPVRVGRRSARNVLIRLSPGRDTGEVPGGNADAEEHPGLTFAVDTGAAAGVLPGQAGQVPPALLMEASRQTALFAAGELYGFRPGPALLTGWEAVFRGFAEPDLPLFCTVAPVGTDSRPARDAAGRAVAGLQLSFTQGRRVVAEISASVLQHI